MLKSYRFTANFRGKFYCKLQRQGLLQTSTVNCKGLLQNLGLLETLEESANLNSWALLVLP